VPSPLLKRSYYKEVEVMAWFIERSDFARINQHHAVSMIVVRYITGDHRGSWSTAMDLSYILGTATDAFVVHEALSELTRQVAPHSKDAPVLSLGSRDGILSNDYHWQHAIARRFAALSQTWSIPDPFYRLHTRFYRDRRVEFTYAGHIRETELTAPAMLVPGAHAFTISGALLVEDLRTGKTRAAIRCVMANLAQNTEQRGDTRTYLAHTALIVVLWRERTNWADAIRELWPDCRIRCICRQKTLVGLKDQILAGSFDVILLPHSFLVTRQFRENPLLDSHLLQSIQFNTVVVDHVHIYLKHCVDTVARVLSGRSKLLVTAYPKFSSHDALRKYLVMLNFQFTASIE
jgi:hypothetical protein